MGSNNTESHHGEQELLLPLSEAKDLLDIVYLVNAILQSDGNLTRTAEELGTARQTLYDLMEKHNISFTEGKLSIKFTPLLHHVEFRAPCLENYCIQDKY